MPSKIIITEDEMVVSLDLEQRLRKLGYEVAATVATGEECLKACDLHHPDLVLMDVCLQGDLDGIQTAALLRSRHDIPVVYLTANADEKTLRRAQLTHPASYLLKPFKERELHIGIEFALSNHALQRQLKEAREQLEARVIERTADLAAANASLKEEMRVRRLAEERTREQAALLDKARDAIFVHTLDGCVTYWNRSAERLYGHETAAALGRPVVLLTGGDGDPSHEHALAATLAQGEWTGELRQRKHDATEFIVESRWTLVRDETTGQPASILVVNTDMTERKKIEAQFLRAQRLESIGSLASGIAHDLKNVFTPLIMSGQLLGDVALSEPDRRMVDMILASARRGAAMVKQVLMFVRGQEGGHETFRLEHLMREVQNLIVETFPRSIRIRSRFSPDLPLVSGDPTQFHQVLMNLCVNARDAMESGGELTLQLAQRRVDEQTAAAHPGVAPGLFLRLTISDTGPGMSSAVLAKIFDPFFTTKPPGKGTGLGLATVQTIIRDHRGFLEVETAPGAGAHFHVHLPAAPSAAAMPETTASAPPQGNGEWILLVDDEISVREIMQASLEVDGYRTLTANDGAEALTQFATHRDQLSCIVLDIMMPHLDGLGTVRALRRMHSTLPIIVISGLDASELPAASLAEHGVCVLPKPLSREQLLIAVHEAITGRTSNR